MHIIQCDEKVHTDKKITSQKEMKDYMEHLELYGDGGTDFRPAFEWVDKLLEQHEFHNLKGMIYFTDGFEFTRRKCHHIRLHLCLCRIITEMWMCRYGP